jgi:hypothetical protein
MNLTKIIQKSLIVLVLLMPALWSTESMAGSVALVLTRSGALINVTDPAGVWQHEGGTVFNGATQIGYYALHRRVTTTGTSTLNTAMETITLFLNTAQVVGNAPRNITIEGAHDFTSGRFRGSVSAASAQYNWIQDANVLGAPSTAIGDTILTIDWLQSTTLTLP